MLMVSLAAGYAPARDLIVMLFVVHAQQKVVEKVSLNKGIHM